MTRTQDGPNPRESSASGDMQAASGGSAGALPSVAVQLRVNSWECALDLDPRTTLRDGLREYAQLTGSKKGCDQGQCGVCTVIVDGRRINSCLTLAFMHESDEIVTIEGLGTPDALHPMQRAFAEHDGFQCGYCTPGQILSAITVLDEIAAGIPSQVTGDLIAPIPLSELELRERMSGNLCRCSAYPNIIAAIREVTGEQS